MSTRDIHIRENLPLRRPKLDRSRHVSYRKAMVRETECVVVVVVDEGLFGRCFVAHPAGGEVGGDEGPDGGGGEVAVVEVVD